MSTSVGTCRASFGVNSAFLVPLLLVLLMSLGPQASALDEGIPTQPQPLQQQEPGAKAPRDGSQSTSLTPSLGDTWNVRCSNGGRCSASYPICCGVMGDMYCVSGGDMCCQNPWDPSQYTSCAPYQTCCAGPGGIACCGTNETCDYSVNFRCVTDPCTQFTDADTCVGAQGSCGWLCKQQRCANTTKVTPGAQVLRVANARCDDPCAYASTCGLCGQTKDLLGASCAWCCQTQSCTAQNVTTCGVMEAVTSEFDEQCPRCGFGGHGLHTVSDSPGGFQMMLMAVVGVSLTVCMGFVLKLALLRRQRLVMEEFAGIDVDGPAGATDPQASVIKYGFTSAARDAAGAPSAEKAKKKAKRRGAHGAVMERRARSGEERSGATAPDEQEAGGTTPGTRSPPPCMSSSSSSSSFNEVMTPEEQARLDEQNPFLRDPSLCDSATNGGGDGRTSQGALQRLPDAVLLPCGHHYNFPAVPPAAAPSSAASSEEADAADPTAGAEMNTARGLPGDVAAKGERGLRIFPRDAHVPSRCPACAALVETTFFPSKVLR